MADTSALAYLAYQKVLQDVLELRDLAASDLPGTARPSKYWEEELQTFDYLLEATPRIIAKLRHHCFHITGVRSYEYRSEQTSRRRAIAARLEALIGIGGRDLLVPESRELGGFGFEIDGALYNLDTLKFFEVNIGLQRMGVIERLKTSVERQLVWEIGGGWGGLARQFKMVVPNVTWVITDFPELFLFSATYVATLIPNARVLIYRGPKDDAALANWREYDFIFLPTVFPNVVPPAPPALTINLVSFQEMTDAQVSAYAKAAADVGTRAIYSLNRDRSFYNTELENVRLRLAEQFELTEVPLLETDYTSALSNRPHPPAVEMPVQEGKEDTRYRHIYGVPKGAVAGDDRSPRALGPDADVRVVLGLVAHDHARTLGEAVNSLLAQHLEDFRLVIYDDASTDKTAVMAGRLTRRDERIVYVRGQTHLGSVAARRRVFEIAAKRFPTMQYFSWATDRDFWSPSWLKLLVERLDADQQVVLAYPYTVPMSPSGQPETGAAPLAVDTTSLSDARERWQLMRRRPAVAADMAMGLVRVDALRRAGVLRGVRCPEQLLTMELALQGQVAQVRRKLLFRRRPEKRDPQSPAQAAEAQGALASLPWWLGHAVAIVTAYGVRHTLPQVGFGAAVRLAAGYMHGHFGDRRTAFVRKYRAALAAAGKGAGAGAS